MWLLPVVHGLRQLRRHRSLSIAVIAIMSLCIGSCVAIFGMVRAVLLADWGYAAPDRIAILWHARPTAAGVVGVGPGDYMSYRRSLATVDAVAAVTTRGFNVGGVTATRVTCARMTAGMFPLLGVPAAQGRWLSPDDDRDGARVVVISERLRRTSFGDNGDPTGRDLVLDGVSYRIAGVMPAAFVFPPEGIQSLTPADCWVPAGFTAAELALPSFSYVLFTRLKQGVSIEQAGADAHAAAQRIWSTYPAALQSQVQLTARVVPLAEQALSRSRTPLVLFGAAVFALLLIGCANVANLVMTGLESRRSELALRASLGATRLALAIQVLSESIVLALIGGLAGIGVAAGLLSAMIATNAAAFPRLADARIDAAAVAFSILCAIVAGIIGAQSAFLPSQTLAATDGVRAAARGFGRGIRSGVIAIELALAVAVLSAAVVLGRSVVGLNAIDAGFDARDLVTLSIATPETSHPSPQSILNFSDEVQRRLRDIPGVLSVAAASAPPVGEASPGVVFAAAAAAPEYKPALVHVVVPEFARTIGMTVREGRFLADTDAAPAPVAAVINESLARALFTGGSVVGRSFHRIGSPRLHTVVGVVADVRQAGPQRPAPPALYVTFAQAEQPVRVLNFMVRSGLTMASLAPQIRRAVAAVDPALPPFALRSGNDLLSGAIAAHRFNMLVVSVFATFALALAMCGVYAVLSHVVHQAQRDAGIRMALGATATRIVRTIIGRALVPAIGGVAAGIAAIAAAAGWLSSIVVGVRADDPATLGAVALIVLSASLIAVLIPARRAARVDLVTLLRSE